MNKISPGFRISRNPGDIDERAVVKTVLSLSQGQARGRGVLPAAPGEGYSPKPRPRPAFQLL